MMVNNLTGSALGLGVYIISGFNWKFCSSSLGDKTLILAREAFDLEVARLRSDAN